MNMPLHGVPWVRPLEPGERLTRDEFERRYHAMPHVKKAELVEGEVLMGSPVSFEFHGERDDDLAWFFRLYTIATPGVRSGGNSTVRLDTDNEPQPDRVVFVSPAAGGRIRLDDGGYIIGCPDLVAEVAASSTAIDLGRKLNAYRRNQVAEYLVWRVYDRAIDWFVFRGGRFDPLPRDADGLLQSPTFPGLWLDPAALIRNDLPAVQSALARGLASAEHAEFVGRLRAAGNPPAGR